QPLVTIGGGATTGPLPIGPLPTGSLPIGALPIGAFPTTGGGGGGWRTGVSAPAAGPATPEIDGPTMTDFFLKYPIPSHCVHFASPSPAPHLSCFGLRCQCSNATSKYFCSAFS